MFHTLAHYAMTFYRSFSAHTSAELQKIGLSFGSLFPIIYVGKHPGCTQSELTRALGLDWGYSQRTVTRLVQDGFLQKEKTGRAYHLSLSEKGRQAYEVSHQVFFTWDRQALGGLTPEEQSQLFALLEKTACPGTPSGPGSNPQPSEPESDGRL